MTLDELRLLYELVDPDLTPPTHTLSREDVALLITPLLEKFICKEAGRRTLEFATMDIKLLRLNCRDFEDFYVVALDLLLNKRPITDFTGLQKNELTERISVWNRQFGKK